MFSEKGQTLLELVVVITVAVIVVGALVFATIASLRNAQFAKNQAQATKLAQEGLEKVRTLRDRDSVDSINYTGPGGQGVSRFSELWSVDLDCPASCRFYFNSGETILIGANSEQSIDSFKRYFLIEDESSTYTTQKQITSIVIWTDSSGPHQSRLTTILRRIQ